MKNIKLQLEGELAEEFDAVRRAKGLTAGTEVLRQLIHEEVARIRKTERGEK